MIESNSPAGDVTSIILAQHQQVQSLLTAIAAGQSDVEDNFCELRRLIAIHETAEQEVVYPTLKASDGDARRMVDERTNEEAEGTKLLAELEEIGVGGADFDETFEKFRAAVLAHAENEEQEVIPLLRRTQTPEGLARMAAAFDLAERAAPTHAHPHSPTSAVGNLLTGPALAIIDRVRDAVRGQA